MQVMIEKQFSLLSPGFEGYRLDGGMKSRIWTRTHGRGTSGISIINPPRHAMIKATPGTQQR